MLIGYCITGSFCTISKSLQTIEELVRRGDQVLPIISEHVRDIDTRFGSAQSIIDKITELTGRMPVTTIVESETLGPVVKCDIMVVAPCTSNTLSKLVRGITDNTVTLAVKAHLRGERPTLLAVCTNDGLGASAKHIGLALERKHFYLCPMYQDAPEQKPRSLVSDFNKLIPAIDCAVKNMQIQPILSTLK